MTDKSSDAPRFLPVGLDLQDRNCVIVGGGSVGTRKAITLTRVGADVTVVAPAVTEELIELSRSDCVRWIDESFRDEHLDGAFLVVAATDDDQLNAAIIDAAVRTRALACDASSAKRSQLIFGALLEDGDATIAVFTGGRDPARARRTRDRIADLIDQNRKLNR